MAFSYSLLLAVLATRVFATYDQFFFATDAVKNICGDSDVQVFALLPTTRNMAYKKQSA